jgi:hypothetical protein
MPAACVNDAGSENRSLIAWTKVEALAKTGVRGPTP